MPLNCILDASWERLGGFWTRLEANSSRLGGSLRRLEGFPSGVAESFAQFVLRWFSSIFEVPAGALEGF